MPARVASCHDHDFFMHTAVRSHRRHAMFAACLALLSGGMAASTPVAAQPAVVAAVPSGACPAILQHTFKRLQDETAQNLCQYAGKVVLVVNTASFCGFTGQYEGLERLYSRLAPQGLVVLGFPANDFGQQEPGSSKEIADFCFNTYAVKFPMFVKSAVIGKEANPLFVALAKSTGKAPAWNFHKYLIDRKGRVLGSWASEVTPEAPALVAQIQKALADK
jgi:glutathione peroxidase